LEKLASRSCAYEPTQEKLANSSCAYKRDLCNVASISCAAIAYNKNFS